ncbi:hypothetical protein SAMN05216229_11677 [Geopseudomonas sagittaria]|uniref:Uncharacterized protein n=1 Tax=Geopseudomonas sagittaria TaxID=1135990 RepID=A0A1I5XHN4_9GAMM|nr:hypothetical protein [Pseudomonas sagittaria]MCM2329662.1 hypothetical protein [Pseudomonas sagittaria]SFQ31488.1 hypothetical protein SAMN05216229_11677 [Pseudomonas sagittaria]
MKRHWLTPVTLVFCLLLVALLLIQLGIERLDRVAEWKQALESAGHYLLLWRLGLYAAIAGLWHQVDRRQTQAAAQTQWRRLGLLSAVLIAWIEISRSGLI